MFTRDELNIIEESVGVLYSSHGHPTRFSVRECNDLLDKVRDVLKNGTTGGTLAHVSTADLDWVAEADEMIKTMVIDEGQKLVAAQNLKLSLEEQNDQLRAKLGRLKQVSDIQAENERLLVENEALMVVPPESQELIEEWRKKYEGKRQECEVLKRQRDGMRQALTSERVERQHLENTRSNADFDPAQQNKITAGRSTPFPLLPKAPMDDDE